MKLLVTGVAGFIGFHTARYLLNRGDTVIGVDNLNDYYDVTLKQARLDQLAKNDNASLFSFRKIDVSEREPLSRYLSASRFLSIGT
jgi:UDP-glucuronate 4-epimerase